MPQIPRRDYNFVGNNLDEEQQVNIDRFKDVCNEHIIKITKKLSDSDRKDIKEFADGIIWTCWNGFGLTKEVRVEQWGSGGIAYLARGSLGENVFKKMAEYCKDERKKKY